MPKEEYEEYEDQREEDNIPVSDPAIAPALSAGLGALHLRNKLKATNQN